MGNIHDSRTKTPADSTPRVKNPRRTKNHRTKNKLRQKFFEKKNVWIFFFLECAESYGEIFSSESVQKQYIFAPNMLKFKRNWERIFPNFHP